MSGHSKWHSIKHKKAITDAKRAGIFTKLAKDITVAAREGGDPETNFRLRMAIDKAKSANMPKENIARAVEKGTGASKSDSQIEEIIYEAYGPGQIAMLIKATTDNKNRTLGEIKNILQKNNGKFVEGGSISWQFEKVGSILIEFKNDTGKEDAEMKIIESGAKDYRRGEDDYSVFTYPQDLQRIKEVLEKYFKINEAGLIFLPKNTVEVDEKIRFSYEKLLEALDENEDVSEVYDNIS